MIERDPYVRIEQAAELLGLTERAVYDKLGNAELIGKRAEEVSGNGKAPTIIQVLSMPTDAQVRYFERAMRPPAPTGETVNLAEAPPQAAATLARRLPLVHRAMELLASRESISNRMDDLAAEAGVATGTLYRWVAAWKRDGAPGLLPKWGQTKGRALAIPEELQSRIMAMYLSENRPSFEDVREEAREFFNAVGKPTPCANTIAAFLQKIPEAVVAYKRFGREAWRKEHEPQVWRDKTIYRPGEMYVGDHRVMDVFVRLGDGPHALIFRPWLTAWLDYRTNTCVGWYVEQVPDSNTIAQSLRDAICKFGIPRELYVDNGKDFKSHYLNGNDKLSRNVGLSEAAQAVLSKGILSPLGVEIRHAQKYTARSKPIEPWFAHALLKWERTLPGWCGNDNRNKPEKLKLERANGDLLTLQEFRARLAACLDEANRTPCHGQGMDGETPLSFWQGVTIERPKDERALDCLMLKRKPVKVTPRGIALFGSKTSPRYYWHEALALMTKQWAVVYCNPQDLGRLVVYNQDNEFVCVAVNHEAMTMKATEAALKAKAREKRNAERRVLAYPDDHRLLMNDQEGLRRAIASLPPPPDPAPAPRPHAGTRVIHRITGAEHVADALARARRAIPPAAPAAPALRDNEDVPAALLRRRPAGPTAQEQLEAKHDAFLQKLLTRRR